jgi:hypothetical protein
LPRTPIRATGLGSATIFGPKFDGPW